MSSIKGGYDLSSITFSPDGRIFQIEYISKFIKKSPLIIGIVCSDGILLFAEKSKKNMKEKYLNSKKIFPINSISSFAGTGQSGDLLRISERIKWDGKKHEEKFSSILCGRRLADKIGELFHIHSIYWHLRPFACSLILGTISVTTLDLFSILPNGFISRNLLTIIGEKSNFLRFSMTSGVNFFKSCRQNFKILSHKLLDIEDILIEKNFDVSWFCREFEDFKKPIAFNLKVENTRARKIFFNKIYEEKKREKCNFLGPGIF